jgi:integrase
MKEMRAIDAGDIQRLIARLTREGKGPKTIRNVWGTIRLIWEAALAQKYSDANLPKPKLPRNVKKKPRFFTLGDAASIITRSENEQQRCMYWLLAESGIRAGELSGLLVSNVELDKITVEQTVWEGRTNPRRHRTPFGQSPFHHSLQNCCGGRLDAREQQVRRGCSL